MNQRIARRSPTLAAAVAFGLAGLVGCGGGGDGGTGPGPEPVATVEISPASPSVLVGETVHLTATVRDKNGTALSGRTVTWSKTTGSTAFNITTSGDLTGVTAGTGTVIATSEQKTMQATVTVIQPPVASITLTPDSATSANGATLVVGDQLPLTVTLKDQSGNTLTGRAIDFQSSNGAVASVSAAGVITAAAEGGPVTITATSEGKNATAKVSVVKPFALVSVNGHAPPVGVVGGLTATGGRFVIYPNNRYSFRITYTAGQPNTDAGSVIVNGTQVTFTRDAGGTFQGTLNGNTLTFVFTGGDTWVFTR